MSEQGRGTVDAEPLRQQHSEYCEAARVLDNGEVPWARFREVQGSALCGARKATGGCERGTVLVWHSQGSYWWCAEIREQGATRGNGEGRRLVL